AGVAEEEPEAVPRVLDACLADPDVGGAILAGHFGGYFKIATPELGDREGAAAREGAQGIARHGKPGAVHTIYGGESLPALDALRNANVPVYRSLEAAARAMAALGRASAPRPAPPAPRTGNRPDPQRIEAILGRASGGEPRLLIEPDARELVSLYGIPVPA